MEELLSRRASVTDWGRGLVPEGEIAIEVLTRPGARREGSGFVVYRELDPDTLHTYNMLKQGIDGSGGDPIRAMTYLARETFLRLEGIRIPPSSVEEYGSERDWFISSADGLALV